MEHKCKCPFCNGTGVFIKKGYSEEDRDKARHLYSKGLTLREIADELKITGSGKAQKIKSMMMSKI
jgi:hypothetical protein